VTIIRKGKELKLEELFSESRLSVLFGENKSAKLSFFLFALNRFFDDPQITIVSPSNCGRMLERLRIAQSRVSNFSRLHTQLSLYFLKPNRNELKVSHGLELLIKDFEGLFEKTKDKYILFHSFNLFFDIPDRRFIEPTVEAIATLAFKYDKRVFFTCDSESENYKHIAQCLNGHADLIMEIAGGEQSTIKKISISYSIYPVEIYNYLFTLKAGTLSLNVASNDVNLDKEIHLLGDQPIKNVLLLSNSTRIIELHDYLLDGYDGINLKICRNLSEALAALLSRPSLIINHCDDIKEHHNLSQALKENNISTNLIFMVNKKYVREEDRIKASELYNCNQIFDLNFRLIDYILAVETSIDERFYPRVEHQDKSATHCKTSNDLNEYLAELRRQRIFYCVHHFKNMTADPQKLLDILRGGDAFCIGEDLSCWVVCVNSQMEDASVIQKKITSVAVKALLDDSSNLLECTPVKSRVAAV